MKRRQFFAAASVGVVGLAALPKTAEASHHRVHAAGFLDDLSRALGLCQRSLDKIVDLVDLDTPALAAVLRYITKPLLQIPRKIDQVLVILESGSPEDLFIARRKLNHPSLEGMREDGNGPSISFHVRQMSWAFHRLEHLVEESGDIPEEARTHFNAGIGAVTQAWQGTDRVIWHVGDAIFEEFYLDEAFAEAPVDE